MTAARRRLLRSESPRRVEKTGVWPSSGTRSDTNEDSGGEITRMMQRHPIIEPAVARSPERDVVGAKPPRRCDDCPVMHLAANALPKRQRKRVGQTVANARFGGDAAVDLGQRRHQAPIHRAWPKALDGDGRADDGFPAAGRGGRGSSWRPRRDSCRKERLVDRADPAR